MFYFQKSNTYRFLKLHNLFINRYNNINKEPTHLLLDGSNGGKIIVEDELLPKFYESVALDYISNIPCHCVAEYKKEISCFFVDFDIKLENLQIESSKLTKKSIDNEVNRVISVLLKIYIYMLEKNVSNDYKTTLQNENFKVCMFTRNSELMQNNDSSYNYKTGIHVYFPNLHIDTETCMMMRALLFKCTTFEQFKYKFKYFDARKVNWDEIIDKGVYDNGHLRIPYVSKITRCKTCKVQRNSLCASCEGTGVIDKPYYYKLHSEFNLKTISLFKFKPNTNIQSIIQKHLLENSLRASPNQCNYKFPNNFYNYTFVHDNFDKSVAIQISNMKSKRVFRNRTGNSNRNMELNPTVYSILLKNLKGEFFLKKKNSQEYEKSTTNYPYPGSYALLPSPSKNSNSVIFDLVNKTGQGTYCLIAKRPHHNATCCIFYSNNKLTFYCHHTDCKGFIAHHFIDNELDKKQLLYHLSNEQNSETISTSVPSNNMFSSFSKYSIHSNDENNINANNKVNDKENLSIDNQINETPFDDNPFDTTLSISSTSESSIDKDKDIEEAIKESNTVYLQFSKYNALNNGTGIKKKRKMTTNLINNSIDMMFDGDTNNNEEKTNVDFSDEAFED